jgi:tetratricopeptide (TPR) repeat protein
MAAQLYRASVEYQPNDAQLRYLWAHALASAGDVENGVTQARHALRLDPDDASTMALLGILLRRQGKNDEAIDLLEKAWNANPRSWAAGRELAAWYLVRGDVERSASMLAMVLERMPDDTRARSLHAEAVRAEGVRQRGSMESSWALGDGTGSVGAGGAVAGDGAMEFGSWQPISRMVQRPGDAGSRSGMGDRQRSEFPSLPSGP